MSKSLMQERRTGEEHVMAKSKPTMSLVSRSVNRSLTLDSGVSYSLGNYGLQSLYLNSSGIGKPIARSHQRSGMLGARTSSAVVRVAEDI